MDKLNLRRELFFAAASGLAGFFILLIARTIVIGVTVISGSIFAGGSLSVWESLILFVCVPVLISLGAAIPAWSLGSNLWGGLLSGVIATGVVVFIHVVGNPVYSPFNNRETLEFVGSVSATVLVSIFTRERLQVEKILVLFTLIVFWLSLKFIIPGNEIELGNITLKTGFLLSLSAWLILPCSALVFDHADT